MFSISILLPSVAFFHLVTHAVFKALLFLGAGVLSIETKAFRIFVG